MATDGSDDRSAAIEDVAFLARTETRVALLAALADCGPCSRDELHDRVDVDRTTLTRNLDDLMECGWVRRSGRTYALTVAGEAVREEFESLVETVELADWLEPFLNLVDDDAFDLDIRHLSDARLVTASEADPYATVNAHLAALETATDARLLLPVVGREATERAHDRLQEEGVEMELVVASEAASVLDSAPSYEPTFEAALDCGLTAFVHDGPVPFYLGLFDDRVQIGVEDDTGVPRAMVESDDPAVREWAERTYASYREAAERLA